MEIITLKNFTKSVSALQLKKSDKLIVRDVDELEPNSFVAYIDIDDESYDVSIKFSDKNEVIETSCECDLKSTLCIHKVAFLNYLSKKASKTNNITRKKKVSKFEEIISNIEISTLKNWVAELLSKNKDLELLFVNQFSNDKKEFTKEEVKTLINNSIKSIIKSKKTIETSELKKIIDLLDVTLKSAIIFCEDNILNKDCFDLLLFIFDELNNFHNKYFLTSVKVERFIEKISNQIHAKIYLIKDNEVWKKINNMFFETIFYDSNIVLTHAKFDLMISLYKNTSDNIDRQAYFANKLEEFYLSILDKKKTPSLLISNFALDVFLENNLFESNFKYFPSYRYENDFNLKLIDGLLNINKINEAETIAIYQIKYNNYAEFNFDYWKRLKIIYTIQKNITKLVQVLVNTVFIDLDFEGLMIIKSNTEKDYYNKFRSNLQGKLKRNFEKFKDAPKFYFQILNSEKTYSKMIENISPYINYDLIFEYREEMYLTNKLAFLVKLTDVESKWYTSKTINLEYREKLIDWILERYEAIILETFLKGKTRYGNSIFYEEFVKKIQSK